MNRRQTVSVSSDNYITAEGNGGALSYNGLNYYALICSSKQSTSRRLCLQQQS